MVASTARQLTVIKKSAEKMLAAEHATIGAASPGDVVRQGDVYLVCLDKPPAGKEIKDRQLAPGTTQGSRHVAEGDCVVIDIADKAAMIREVNRLVPSTKGVLVSGRDEVLIGPAIECRKGVTITHPEHGDRSLEDGSIWLGLFQREHAEETRRVRD
jgi:hypothetical protein